MQVIETSRVGLKRGCQITLAAVELDAKVNEKLAKARSGFVMKGFRKGKVPMTLLRKQLGGRAFVEAMEDAAGELMDSHFEKTGERPVTEPKIELVRQEWKEGEDVVFQMFYETLPEIPEIDLKAIHLERLVAKPDDADLDAKLEELAKELPHYVDGKKGAKAKNGDQVLLDFKLLIDGKEFHRGVAEDFPVVLGERETVPGFNEQLIGVTAGQEVEINTTYPDDFSVKDLRGKKAVFACLIKAVQVPESAAIDDKFAKKLNFEDLEEMKKIFADLIGTEFSRKSDEIVKRKLMDALDELVHFDLPASLVDDEAKSIAHGLWHEENPDAADHDHPEIKPTKEHKEIAARRVRLALFMNELGRKNNINVSDNEVFESVRPGGNVHYLGRKRNFEAHLRQNPQALEQIRSILFEKKAAAFILELADIKEKRVSKDEFLMAWDALEAD